MLVEICSRLHLLLFSRMCVHRRSRSGKKRLKFDVFVMTQYPKKFSGPFGLPSSTAQTRSSTKWPAAASNANRCSNCSTPILECSAAIFSNKSKCFCRARSAYRRSEKNENTIELETEKTDDKSKFFSSLPTAGVSRGSEAGTWAAAYRAKFGSACSWAILL